MLPVLDPKKISSVIISRRKDKNLEVKSEVDAPGNEQDSDLENACHGILAAIEQKSIKDLAQAIKEAVQACSYTEEDNG